MSDFKEQHNDAKCEAISGAARCSIVYSPGQRDFHQYLGKYYSTRAYDLK
jgi:hypothetical protein